MPENERTITVGDYIVIQRQKYTKLHKFGNLESTAMLGKEQIELRNINGKPFYSTFKMIPNQGKRSRVSSLEVCSEIEVRKLREVLGIKESGIDNRNISDNGDSQSLNKEDIEKLREVCTTSSEIVEKIVENSKTFHSKTEYSQEKYLKKKEKKYFEFVQIREPTIRLITEIFYRQDPEKVMGIRMDTLSQIVSYSGISSFGNFLMYESGSNGLLPAALLNSMGSGTEAKLVFMHPGHVPQKQAILALNLPEEQTNRCIAVNIYSALREFYQGSGNKNGEENSRKRKADDEAEEQPAKKTKCEESESLRDGSEIEKKRDSQEETPAAVKPDAGEIVLQKWQIENKRACEIMKEKFDGLIIAAREHPTSIVKALLPFLRPSRPFVIFNSSREILMELYIDLKATTQVTGLHLTSNWLRKYQILPNRTHPEVMMNGNSGYLLCGYSIS